MCKGYVSSSKLCQENKIKVFKKLSRIEESNKEFTENDNESVEKDESYDDNIMLNFNEDGNFIE